MVLDEPTKDSKAQAEDFVRKIWLAGLGVYGKSREEAQTHYEKFSVQTSKMFDDLVKQGEKMEEEAKSRFNETPSEVETRVNEVRKKLGLDGDKTQQKIAELSAKIDALTEAVAKLADKQKSN